MIASLRKVFT